MAKSPHHRGILLGVAGLKKKSSHYRGKLLTAPIDLLTKNQVKQYRLVAKKLQKIKKFSSSTSPDNRKYIIADLSYKIVKYPFGPTAHKYKSLIRKAHHKTSR